MSLFSQHEASERRYNRLISIRNRMGQRQGVRERQRERQIQRRTERHTDTER